MSVSDNFKYVIEAFSSKQYDVKEELINHDNAFLNSFLSYGIYTGRKYLLDFIHNSSPAMKKYQYNYAGKADFLQVSNRLAENIKNIYLNDAFNNDKLRNVTVNGVKYDPDLYYNNPQVEINTDYPLYSSVDFTNGKTIYINNRSSNDHLSETQKLGSDNIALYSYKNDNTLEEINDSNKYRIENSSMRNMHLEKTSTNIMVDLLALKRKKKPVSPIIASDVASPEADKVIQEIIQKNTGNLTIKKAYEIYMGDFIRKTFDLVDLPNLDSHLYHSEKYNYRTNVKFENGLYEALNNLASAGVFRSKNPDGTFTLHVAFRGTDTEASSMTKYIHKAYADMTAYYDCFKPLEKAVLEYAQDKSNNISKLHVSGHSLGGSMVQQFFSSNDVKEFQKQSSIDVRGYTYGAPGSLKKLWYSLLPEAYHTIRNKKFKQLGMQIYNSMKDTLMDQVLVIRNSLATKDPTFIASALTTSFFQLGNDAITWGLPSLSNKIKNRLDRKNSPITEYSHTGDLIPRVGWLGYDKMGRGITLDDMVSNNQREVMMFENTGHDARALQKIEAQKKEDIQLIIKCIKYAHDKKLSKFKNIGLSATMSNGSFLLVFAKRTISSAHEILIAKPLSLVKKVVALDYHDMLRYVKNLNHHVDNLLTQNPELKELHLTPRIEQFEIHNAKFTKAYKLFEHSHYLGEDSLGKNPGMKVKGVSEVLKMVQKRRIANMISQDVIGEDSLLTKVTVKRNDFR